MWTQMSLNDKYLGNLLSNNIERESRNWKPILMGIYLKRPIFSDLNGTQNAITYSKIDKNIYTEKTRISIETLSD